MKAEFPVQWIESILKDQILTVAHGHSTPSIVSITSDSRKATPGALFVALKGDRVDGHHYISQALESKASAIMAESPPDPARPSLDHHTYFHVKNSLKAYRSLAKAWRMTFPSPVIMVAGSNGKTTTKEVLASILSGKWPKLLKTQGSENGFVGIPLTLLELRESDAAAVIEVGIDEPGAMLDHCEVVNPSFTVVTAIGPEHLEKLGTLEIAAREERKALEFTSSRGGLSFVLMDDPEIAKVNPTLLRETRRTLSLRNPDCDYYLSPDLQFHCFGKLFLTLSKAQLTALPGKHNLSNLHCALSIAHALGLTPQEITSGLAKFTGAYGRSSVEYTRHGQLIYCDYYNAQPLSVRAGLLAFSELFDHQPGPSSTSEPRLKWVCLGDMLELGNEEERYHREVARVLLQIKAQQVLLFGQKMKWLENECLNLGYQSKGTHGDNIVRHFTTRDDLAQVLLQEISSSDAIFIKGSRGMKMEEIHHALQKS